MMLPHPKIMTPARHRHHRRQRPLVTLLLIATSLSLLLPHPTAAQTTTRTNNRHNNNNNQQQQVCERLPTSLTYSQDSAPADVSAILRVVVEKINRDVTGVVDVEVAWSGAELHRRVGERIVRCTVTRLADSIDDDDGGGGGEDEGSDAAAAVVAKQSTIDDHGRSVITQCFEVPFTILDVNECTVPKSNPMAHRCHPPSSCVNTLGSYECLCPSESEANNNAQGIVGGGEAGVALSGFWETLDSQSRNAWELSLGSSSDSSCPDSASTRGCCDEDGHSADGEGCRSSFRCPVDPCARTSTTAKNNNNASKTRSAASSACASNAICQRATSPLHRPNYTCQCPPGLMGNGKPCTRNGRKVEPKVKYDGKTPTEETRRALEKGLICGCVEATVDACDGFPKCPGKHEMCAVSSSNTPGCTCQNGYVHDPDYGCVDESPPLLHLRPDPTHGTDPKTGTTHLSQGDRYEEYGVDVIDDNAEEYYRSLKIAYSRPLPQGCLLEVGEFHVNYTVATPWTSPDFVRAKRTVVIDNIDECAVRANVGVGADCPELVPMCDDGAGATCRDETGTYACRCPEGTEGDGFRPIPRLREDGRGGYAGIMVPRGYAGGTGCRDTRKPVMELVGPNPKRFRVARTSAVKGVMRRGEDSDESNARVQALLAEQRSAYESDIRSVIKATSGAELCATSTKPNVRPTDCVRAQDHTYRGIVDLTSRVSVGEPVPKEGDGGASFEWKVPYNVMDDAGNKATTVWRDIIVEEVDIDDFERRAKMDMKANEKEEVDRAVEEALAKERRKRRSPQERECPTCDPCNCNNQKRQRGGTGGMMSVAECNAMCDHKLEAAASSFSAGSSGETTCTPSYIESKSSESYHRIIQEMLIFVEGLMGPSAMMLLLFGCTLATGLYMLRRIIGALFFSTDVQTYYHTREDDEREKIMMQNVSYYRSPTPSSRGSNERQSPGSASPAPGPVAGPRPPPTTSISSQRARNGGIFSPQQNTGGGNTIPTPRQSSPFLNSNGTDSIYQSMSPITPLRNGFTPPASSSSSAGKSQGSNGSGQRSPYNSY